VTEDVALADDLRHDAEVFARSGREKGYRLDYSEASIVEVERLLTDWTVETPEGPHVDDNLASIAAMIGAYVGEVMIRNLGGYWTRWEDYIAVKGPEVYAFPLDKAIKRAYEPLGNQLDYFYEVMKRDWSGT
jgi:hypothetical protein